MVLQLRLRKVGRMPEDVLLLRLRLKRLLKHLVLLLGIVESRRLH